jgi:hypothetical protein
MDILVQSQKIQRRVANQSNVSQLFFCITASLCKFVIRRVQTHLLASIEFILCQGIDIRHLQSLGSSSRSDEVWSDRSYLSQL